MFPADPILIARGKYATLSRERRKLLRDAQDHSQSLMASITWIMRDCEAEPPSDIKPLQTAGECITGLQDIRGKIVELSNQMLELKPEAWK